MKPVVFHRAARRELDQAMTWYERQQNGPGLDLEDEVEHVVSRIQNQGSATEPI